VLASAMLREGSWSRSNSFWGTSQFKPPNGTLGARNGFDQQSMIALALSRILELGATVIEEWPTTRDERSISISGYFSKAVKNQRLAYGLVSR